MRAVALANLQWAVRNKTDTEAEAMLRIHYQTGKNVSDGILY